MTPRVRARTAGLSLVGLFAVLLVLNVRWMAVHWDRVSDVATPVGEGAPPFRLALRGGGEVRSDAPDGRALVLAFWATWCGPCRAELPVLERVARRYADRARVIAVNMEPPTAGPSIDAFVRETGLGLPVALGGGEVADRFHVETIPHLTALDAAGTVRAVLIGVHGEGAIADALDQAVAPGLGPDRRVQ